MSQKDVDPYNDRYLSWRKLHLSRAKLKASSKTSALLSGFAMVAMVELNIEVDQIPRGLLGIFILSTILLVSLHMLALMISTCILPHIETVCNLDSVNLVRESPHERLHWYVEAAWVISTLIGLLLFLVEVAILCWFKFNKANNFAAWIGCFILIPILFVFIAFAIHFYKTLMIHKYETTLTDLNELELLKDKIERSDTLNYAKHTDEMDDGIQVV